MHDVIIIGGSFAGLAAALQLGRAGRKATAMFTKGTPRWLHQAVFSRVMGATTDRGDAHAASVKVARR